MSIVKFLLSKVFWKQVAFAIIGVGLLVFLVFQYLRITTNHNQKIEVPDLSKQPIDLVEKTLEEYNLRYIVRDSASYNPDYPKKSVIRQNPEPGDIVKENRQIYLTLNPSGYRMVRIPDIIFDGDGQTKRNVAGTLRSVGFLVAEKSVFVPDRAKNLVKGLQYKGKKLKKGDKLPKKSVLTLVLGDGTGG